MSQNHRNALHLFCGAYGGWARGLRWLSEHEEKWQLGTQVFLDADPAVLDTRSALHQQEHHRGPTSPAASRDASRCVGVCTTVDDATVAMTRHAVLRAKNWSCCQCRVQPRKIFRMLLLSGVYAGVIVFGVGADLGLWSFVGDLL